MKTAKGNEKGEDKLSHADNMFKNYIAAQSEALSKQKMRVGLLAQQADKVINNEIEED